MYIWIYASAPVVLVFAIVVYFIVFNKKREKTLRNFHQEQIVLTEPNDMEMQHSQPLVEEKKNENIVDPCFEDFSLEEEEKEEQGLKPLRINPFQIREEDFEDEEVKDDFSEYEELLKARMQEDSYSNYDEYEPETKTTHSKLEELLKNLPPKKREFLMAEIMAKRNYEDEE